MKSTHRSGRTGLFRIMNKTKFVVDNNEKLELWSKTNHLELLFESHILFYFNQMTRSIMINLCILNHTVRYLWMISDLSPCWAQNTSWAFVPCQFKCLSICKNYSWLKSENCVHLSKTKIFLYSSDLTIGENWMENCHAAN